jgi:hypothetical protein
MANAPTEESISHMPKLQSRMRSRLSLDNPEIHSCYWKSTSESSLTNRYGTRRSRNGLVVGGATTYKWGDDRTGSAGRKHLGAHLPAENRRWRLVDECTLENITSRVNKRTWRRVNKQNDDVDTQTSDSKHTWRRGGKHTRRKPGERTQQLEDDQCDCKSTGVMMRRQSEFDLCRTSAFMSTEAVPNETENDLRTYQIVYRMAS